MQAEFDKPTVVFVIRGGTFVRFMSSIDVDYMLVDWDEIESDPNWKPAYYAHKASASEIRNYMMQVQDEIAKKKLAVSTLEAASST